MSAANGTILAEAPFRGHSFPIFDPLGQKFCEANWKLEAALSATHVSEAIRSPANLHLAPDLIPRIKSGSQDGTSGRTRTGTLVKEADFESVASNYRPLIILY